ncbi:MAG TPA: hypothetical protein VGE12_17980 [Noviherbaspirillum sp.]
MPVHTHRDSKGETGIPGITSQSRNSQAHASGKLLLLFHAHPGFPGTGKNGCLATSRFREWGGPRQWFFTEFLSKNFVF